ncbi:MAG TPA: GYDIA family GHMP kinase [Xanthomarina sp.]|nr:GYDIA family GHMP kinase [Xanthomarina sp.]
MTSKTHYSNGKLLLTGEYVVLDGALSLAVPTSFGQSMEVKPLDEPKVIWRSLDYKNNLWFKTEIKIKNLHSGLNQFTDGYTLRLFEILQAVNQLNPEILNSGHLVETKLTFPQDWGLGSSSTLINNIANWAKVDPYKLLELTFGGSGYDIACAQFNKPITYQLGNNIKRTVKEVDFNPSFKDALYFVHLNKKQNSREGIAHYKANKTNKTEEIKEVSNITTEIISCTNLSDFQELINNHEQLVSKIIQQIPVKVKLFPDFIGAVKSLGAWGGDFILVTSEDNPERYFKQKGYTTILPYSEMIK